MEKALKIQSEDIEAKDNIKAYQETCNTIRHYSNSSYNVRVLVIIQGLVIMGAWILNYEKQSSILLISISVFGLLFSLLLALFHHGYFFATKSFYDLAAKMEDVLFDYNF